MDKINKVVHYVQENFNSVKICYTSPPSYVARLTGSEPTEKIIFISNSNVSLATTTSVKHNKKDSSIDLDLTGSPLKDDCDIDVINGSFCLDIENKLWNIAEEKYMPISIQLARNILNKVNFQSFFDCQSSKDCASIWILCKWDEDEKCALLSSKLQSNFNSNAIVYILDQLSYESINSIKLLEQHLSYSYIKDTPKISSTIESVFNIQSNVQLTIRQIATVNCPLNLQTLDLFKFRNDSDVILSQKIYFNNQNKVTALLSSELNLLNLINENIANFENADTSTEDTICRDEIDVDKLKKNMMNILSGVAPHVNFTNEEEYQITSVLNDNLEENIGKAQKRKFISITDNLWNLLKFYTVNDCKMALSILFQCVANCHADIPTTTNRLSELLHEISQQRIAIPHLRGSEPWQLLLEIGIEKLTRDYETIFAGTNICTENDLKMFFSTECLKDGPTDSNPQKSRFTMRKTLFEMHTKKSHEIVKMDGFQNTTYNEREIAHRLSKLGQIHLMLEHLLLAQRNFNLKNLNIAIFKHLSQKPAKPLRLLLVNTLCDNILEIPIVDQSKFTFSEDSKPNLKRIALTSSKNDVCVSNVFYYSMDPIFPFQDNSDDVNIIQPGNKLYYGTQYLKIETKK